MNRIIDNIADTFKGLLFNVPKSAPTISEEKLHIEGYHIVSDPIAHKTLILVKESDKYWKTQWFNDSTTVCKSPRLPLNAIFIGRN